MVTTEYAIFSTDELVRYTLMTGHRTPLEMELAQRLEQAVEMIKSTFTPERIQYAESLS